MAKQRLKVMAKNELRYNRIRRGYTLERFAKAIGYSVAGYGKVELQRNGTRPAAISAIMKELEMDFDELFEFVDNEEENEQHE